MLRRERNGPRSGERLRQSGEHREVSLAGVALPAFCDTPAELRLDTHQHGLVLPVNVRDHLERENVPPSEQSSAHDNLVGVVGVTLIANVIDPPEGAPLLVQDDVALSRSKQPAELAPLSWLTLGARFAVLHEPNGTLRESRSA
jgi:hypothetical protein